MREMSDKSTSGRGGFRVLPTLGLVTTVVGAVVIVAMLAGAVGMLTGWRPSLNPFQEKIIDRTGPSVLQSLTGLSEYHAATAHYEIVVDMEGDTSRLPAWVNGERVLYVAKGDVDALVDFGELDERRVVRAADGTSVTIRLPVPTVDKPVLDLQNSYVADHDKGLVNKFKGSELEKRAQLKAVGQLAADANREDRLIDLAKKNTSAMLHGLLGSLGYTSVTITFDEDPR